MTVIQRRTFVHGSLAGAGLLALGIGIGDATRGIDLNGSLKAAWAQMARAGVKRIQSSDIAV